MSLLYSLRKKVATNPVVALSIKKAYMAVKAVIVRKKSKKEIAKACDIAKSNKKVIWYLDVPTHSNMGDLAQYCCIQNWLKENYPAFKVIELSAESIVNAEKDFLAILSEHDTPEHMIFFQSGYCTQDLGGTHDYVHKLVVGHVKRIPIIMLPQTILYKSEERARQAAAIYGRNHYLLILCRDKVSYETAQNLFLQNQSLLYPDIVTSLIGSRNIRPAEERKGIMICCRNDIERFYNVKEIAELKKDLEIIDRVTLSDTTVQEDFKKVKSNLDGYIDEIINEFGKYKAVITDRYHGTIFSLIAGTPVIVIKSNDHKVVTGVDWFKGIYDTNVWYIDDLKSVQGKVLEIYDNFEYRTLDAFFSYQFYSKLKFLIEDWKREVTGNADM